MRSFLVLLAALVFFSRGLYAHDEDAENRERARIANEVTAALQLVADHERGKTKATDEALAAAQKVIQADRARREKLEREKPEPPIIINRQFGSQIDLVRTIQAVNREFVIERIAELKRDIAANEEKFNAWSRRELKHWETALANSNDHRKPWAGGYVTIHEESDRYVVAYFSSNYAPFVCQVSKKDYSPLPRAEALKREAFHTTMRQIIGD